MVVHVCVLSCVHVPMRACASILNLGVCACALLHLQGLEAQLLGIVVRKERPELEEQRDSLVTSIACGKRRLQELEDQILRLFS